MVNPNEFKGRIMEIISQEYEIGFLGDDFDQTVEKISSSSPQMSHHLYDEALHQLFLAIF